MAGFSGIGTGGFGPNSAFRFTGFRFGSLDGRNNTFRYPSPWWDVAHMEMPTTIKHLFRWCLYHSVLNPLIKSVSSKMASYPITDVIIDDQPEEGFDQNKKRWEDVLFRVLDIGRLQIEIGLNYWAYGNCIVSLLNPFKKFLQCKSCGSAFDINKLTFRKDWDFKNFDYLLSCGNCGHHGPSTVEDKWFASHRELKVILWHPQDIDIDFNPITQTSRYAYNIPGKVRKKVLQKNEDYLRELPDNFVQAMKYQRPVVLDRRNVFHFKAPTPTLSGNDAGWGYPPILPALKDSFYLQIMKKAQEAVMLEHLMPLDIIYPATSDANASPYQMVNLSDWKRRVELEFVKWRWDPNYKSVMPLPVGYQRIGGDGKALLLTQEIRAHSEHIIAGMGAPQEFVFGGLSYSGSSVSLRMLENQFMTYRSMHDRFLKHFLIPKVAQMMGWETVPVHMANFKMADDIQSKQILLSLNQLKKVSDKTLLAEFSKDALEEAKLVEEELRRNLDIAQLEQLTQASIQGKALQIQTKYQMQAQAAQMKAQAKMQEEAAADQGEPEESPLTADGVDAGQLAQTFARRLSSMQPFEREQLLQKIRSQNPQLHDLIAQNLQTDQAMNQEPLPEVKPPRRGPESASI